VRRASIALILAATPGACATYRSDLDGARNSWNGARYDEVVAKWGAPTRHAKLTDGRDVYTWDSTTAGGGGYPGSVGVYGGSGVGVGIVLGLPGFGGGEPQRCERILTFSSDRVVSQSWLGSPAFCSTFRRE
jgi:hypothetical protein